MAIRLETYDTPIVSRLLMHWRLTVTPDNEKLSLPSADVCRTEWSTQQVQIDAILGIRELTMGGL